MRRYLVLAAFIFGLVAAPIASADASSWVVTILDDEDKADVGVITAVFTDDDGTKFIYSRRIQANLPQLNLFVSDVRAARTAWQAKKSIQTSQMTTAVARFTAAGEVNVTAGVSK